MNSYGPCNVASSVSSRPASVVLKIGQLAKLAGLPVATLRVYEEQGLLRPGGRTQAGYRWFGPEALIRLQFVSRARLLGIPLRAIAAIIQGAQRQADLSVHRGHA